MAKRKKEYEQCFLQLLVREYDKKSQVILDPNAAIETCRDLFAMPKEVLVVLCLDAKSRIITREIVTVGTLTASLIHPREVFRLAISMNASAVIVLHNHPSGDINPSDDDITIADRLSDAGKLLGISMIDFIVYSSDNPYYSYTETK
jgi:DNA repair protein RadC